MSLAQFVTIDGRPAVLHVGSIPAPVEPDWRTLAKDVVDAHLGRLLGLGVCHDDALAQLDARWTARATAAGLAHEPLDGLLLDRLADVRHRRGRLPTGGAA